MNIVVNTAQTTHSALAASAWVQRWSHLVPAGGTVLDVACGHGRHMAWFAARGHAVTGVDRSPEAIGAARQWGEAVLADIENAPWPLVQAPPDTPGAPGAPGAPRPQPRTFDAVIVTNYLSGRCCPPSPRALRPAAC